MLILDLADYAHTASLYHGGQASMLYAVASTGGLSRGSVRPTRRCSRDHGYRYFGCVECSGDGRVNLTDAEWSRNLVKRLLGEVESALDLCDDESDEENEHFTDLYAVQSECEAWLRANPAE